MTPYLHAILIMSSVMLSGFGLSIWSVFKAQARNSRFQLRVNTMSTPHLRSTNSERASRLRLGAKLPDGTFLRRLSGLIGYDSNRREHHPLPWPVVVGLGFLISLVAEKIAAAYLGSLAWLVCIGCWIFVCRKFFQWSDERLTAVLYRQFPDALAMIVRSVRVGIPVSEAVRVVGREAEEPTSQEFVRVGHELSIGVSLDRALKDLADRSRLPEYRFFATALSLQSQTGGALGETLDSLADTIRKRVAARARGKALAAEARASALVLTGLPIAVGTLLSFINPGYMMILIADTGGKRLLGTAVGLLIVGTLIMRNMIKKSLA